MTLSLVQALRLSSSPCLALTGAGGKTTALFQIARTLRGAEGTLPVIVTATSHLGAWQTSLADMHIITDSPAAIEELEHGLKGVILVTGPIDAGRTHPVDPALLEWLHRFCGYHSLPLLIEADGSRQKPLKGWDPHEPPVPGFVEMVVQVAGLSGIGQTLTAESVHRPQLFARLSGLQIGESVDVDALRRVLIHPEGGRKNLPPQARTVALLNQADTPELQAAGQGLARSLLPSYDAALVASLKEEEVLAVYEPIAGVVLAAGEGRRFGQPKQLLDWKGQPFVRAVARTALQAGLSPVIVVTGAHAGPVEAALADLPVTVVHNEAWEAGQAGSIRAAVQSLDGSVGGAVFLLADQPQLTASVLRALVETHARGLHPIVAPMVMDRRANPVLFDSMTFPDLLTLEGDVGGREIFHRYRVEYLPWHDDRLLLDVDTPEMYRRLIEDDTL